MFGPKTLLFPDTGKDFLRCLKQAALYCDEIRTFTILDFEFAKDWSESFAPLDDLHVMERDEFALYRLADYFRFITANWNDLQLCQTSGLLTPVLEKSAIASFSDAAFNVHRHFLELHGSESFDEHLTLFQFVLDKARQHPPGFADVLVLYLSAGMYALQQHTGEKHHMEWLIDQVYSQPRQTHGELYLIYLFAVATAAAENGLSTTSWDPEHLTALDYCRSLVPRLQSGVAAQQHAEIVTGKLLLERHLPDVSTLPIEAVLEIRRERAAELDALRSAIATLAADLDPSLSLPELERAAYRGIVRQVDPALRALGDAVVESRLRVLSKIRDVVGSSATKVVPAAISLMLGAPLDVTAALALFGAGGAVLEQLSEHSRAKRGGEWGVLIRLGADVKKRINAAAP